MTETPPTDEKTIRQQLIEKIGSSPFTDQTLDMNALVAESKAAGLKISSYDEVGQELVIDDNQRIQYTIKGGRLKREEFYDNKATYDGKSASQAWEYDTQLTPDGKVESVTKANYFLPKEPKDKKHVLDAIHIYKPSPNTFGKFYNSSYQQIDHFSGKLMPPTIYPIPTPR